MLTGQKLCSISCATAMQQTRQSCTAMYSHSMAQHACSLHLRESVWSLACCSAGLLGLCDPVKGTASKPAAGQHCPCSGLHQDSAAWLHLQQALTAIDSLRSRAPTFYSIVPILWTGSRPWLSTALQLDALCKHDNSTQVSLGPGGV